MQCSMIRYRVATVRCMHAYYVCAYAAILLQLCYVQVIERANNVQYGLSACVWSENSGITHRVAQALDVCRGKHFKCMHTNLLAMLL